MEEARVAQGLCQGGARHRAVGEAAHIFAVEEEKICKIRVVCERSMNLLIPLYRTYRNIIVAPANEMFQLADEYRSQEESQFLETYLVD